MGQLQPNTQPANITNNVTWVSVEAKMKGECGPLWRLLLLHTVLFSAPVLSCKASRHPHLLAGSPRLFIYSHNATLSNLLCDKYLRGQSYEDCFSVKVNLHSFLARSLSLQLNPPAEVSNSLSQEEEIIILVKKMELGLQAALQRSVPFPLAPVSY